MRRHEGIILTKPFSDPEILARSSIIRDLSDCHFQKANERLSRNFKNLRDQHERPDLNETTSLSVMKSCRPNSGVLQ